VNPDGVSGGYGYTAMGPSPGGQAEYLRVPFGEFNCLKLPGSPGDELEDDFLLLSDVFPTGYHGAELAEVGPGDTVAVFGAGPVGLLAAYSAMLRGAAEVYVVDDVAERLACAEQVGAIAIDFSQGSPSEQIMSLRRKNQLATAALRPGEEKMMGVMCGIDAVGYQARGVSAPDREQPTQIIDELVKVVNPTGRIGIVGVYFTEDPKGVDKAAKQGRFQLALGEIFEKGLRIGTGQTPVKKYNTYLRDLIVAGRAKPSFIVSHRLPLEKAPEAYRKFDRREDGYTKVILKPGMDAQA
jgi:glutathione-independent formaldehyde dehydrogenase